MKALNVVIILLSVVCTACTTIGIMENNRVETVSFGSGGGVTGEIITYTLNRDGNIYRNGSFMKRVPKKEVNRLFGKIKAISDYRYNIPHNMYNFLVSCSKADAWAAVTTCRKALALCANTCCGRPKAASRRRAAALPTPGVSVRRSQAASSSGGMAKAPEAKAIKKPPGSLDRKSVV